MQLILQKWFIQSKHRLVAMQQLSHLVESEDPRSLMHVSVKRQGFIHNPEFDSDFRAVGLLQTYKNVFIHTGRAHWFNYKSGFKIPPIP